MMKQVSSSQAVFVIWMFIACQLFFSNIGKSVSDQDFANFIRVESSCLTAHYLVSVYVNMSVLQCYEKCEEIRCMSFSYDTPQKVCFLSHFNSNSARNEINSCLLHSRNMTYYERIGSGPKTQGCQFPFLWKNKLYYECVEIDNQEMCSNTNGFHQPISWTECPDCFDSLYPSQYRSKKQLSKSGKRCLNWKFSAFNWKSSAKGLGDHSYCRNPDNDRTGIWCYVNATHHEYCDVPMCPNAELTATSDKPNVCGQSSLFTSPKKIIGGKIAVSSSAFPWQVVFFHKRHRTVDCGGVLLTSCYILTAAHCFKKSPFTEYEVQAGFSDHQVVQKNDIEQVFLHPMYNAFRLNHDIAVVKLIPVNNKCFKINQIVLPSCLPTSLKQFVAGKSCVVSGVEVGNLSSLFLLRYAQVPLVTDRRCKQDKFLGSHLTANMFCAGYFHYKQDSCKGDSGSPLVCLGADKRWYLWGLVSWGDTCGVRPGVYTKVYRYLKWIRCVTSSSTQCQFTDS